MVMSLNPFSRIGGGTGTDNHKVRVGHQSRAAQQPEPKTGFLFFFFNAPVLPLLTDGSGSGWQCHFAWRPLLCQKSLSYHAVAYKKGANYKCMGGLSGGLGKKKKAAIYNLFSFVH